jgi:hypothetical protein
VVVLDERYGATDGGFENLLVVAFEEEAAIVAENAGFEEDYSWDS